MLELITSAAAAIIAAAASWLAYRSASQQRAALELKARDATNLEATAAREESLVEYIDAQLVAAAARQEVVVVTSGSRADRLATAGFVLMVSSVLIPSPLSIST
jgi:hypothetical protein